MARAPVTTAEMFEEFQVRYFVQLDSELSFNNVGWQDYKKKLSGGGAPKEKKAKGGKKKKWIVNEVSFVEFLMKSEREAWTVQGWETMMISWL